MEAIFQRSSIRKYKDMPVEENKIKRLLEAAMAAPSAGNERPWQFLVINNREILREITTFHPYANMLNECHVAIVVCGDMDLDKFNGFWIQDCSAATENILIEATYLGLGSVWLGVYPLEERIKGLQKLLNLPDSIIPLSIIPVGYSIDGAIPKRESYMEDRIHTNRW